MPSSNVVFAKPGTPVVTIGSSADFVDGHVNLITSCDLACGVILGQLLWIDAALREIDRFTN
jgi:hypothetical protein